MRALTRVVHPVVLEHEPADLVDLRRTEGVPMQHLAHALRVRGLRALEHRDERQCPFAFAQVGADRLAEAVLIGHEVERVVGDLKRDADVEPVARQRLERLGGDAAEEAADTAARGDERRRLLRDDPDVVRLGRDPAALAVELEDLRLGHGDGRAGEGFHDPAIVVPDEELEGLGVEMVADEDRRVVSPARVGRRPSAPQRRLIDDVVVDERRRVEQLDHGRQPHRPLAPRAREPRRQEEQDRAQTLAAGAGNVAAHLLDEADRRIELATDLCFDRFEVGAHERSHALLEQTFEGRSRHAARATSRPRDP